MSPALSIAPLARQSIYTLPPKKGEAATRPETPIVQFAQAILDGAFQYRDSHLGMSDRWKAYRSWYLAAGEAWGKKSNTYSNNIFEKVESVTADLSDAEPTILYSPRGPTDLNLTEFLNHVVPFVWDSEDAPGKYHEALKAACLYGTAYWKVVHDPGFPNTGPRVRIQNVPPWSIYPAPYATSFEDSPYIIEVRPRTVGEIWAEYGVRVQPELVSRETDPAQDMTAYPQAVAVETATGGGVTGGDLVGGYYSSMSSYMDDGVVFQKELWIKDGSRVMEYAFEEGLDSPIPVLKKMPTLKYPEGRVISWANGRLLYDRPSPYKDGEFPYVRFRDGTLPDFWFGQGEVEPLIPLQLMHDDTHDVIKLFHLFTCFGRLVVDTGTGLEEGQLENTPNQILWVQPGTADRVKWLTGLSPPPELYQYLKTIESAMDRVSGRWDVTRGEQPGSVTAARGLMVLQQAANVRVRDRMKEIERALKRAGKLIGSRVQQFWPSELSAVVGAPPTNMEDRVFKKMYLTPEDRTAKFNTKVSAISNLDAAKEKEFQKKLLFKQMGLIDDEELIRSANLMDEEEIIQKLPAVKMQNILAQIASMQAGGAPGQPGQNGGGMGDQTRAGNEADQQARRQRANNRAVTPAQ